MSGPRIAAFAFAALCACGGSNRTAPPPETRPFLMGFTPWPYDATIEAVDWVYERIAEHGDLISHHIEEGVPWPEALAGAPFPASFDAEIAGRVARREPGQRVLLSLNALDVGRSGLAAYRGNTPNEPRPAPWNGYALNAPDVKAAYVTYVTRMVNAFDPDYLLIGIETNLLLTNTPSAWPAYVDLQQHTYQALAAAFPELPIGIGVLGPALLPYSPEHDPAAQLAALRELEANADFVGLSCYPFMSTLLCESLPDDWFADLIALVELPFGISESGYPAQEWTLPNPPTVFRGSPQKQLAFTQQMLADCAQNDALFAVWFTVRDYDQLWNGVLAQDPVALVWRDTGLYGEDGVARSSLAEWSAWRARSWQR